VYPTSKYWNYPKSSEYGTVLLNYGGVSLPDIPVAVDLLYQAWLGNKPGAMKNFDAGSFTLS
jgi:hypothetical protein